MRGGGRLCFPPLPFWVGRYGRLWCGVRFQRSDKPIYPSMLMDRGRVGENPYDVIISFLERKEERRR